MLKELKIEEFLRELALPSPAPGSSAMAALATALAAGLLSKYCAVSQDREKIGQFTDRLREIGEESRFLLNKLLETFDEDTVALNLVMEAGREKAGSLLERPDQKEMAIEAEVQSASIPLQAARGSLRLLSLVSETEARGNPEAITELGAANLQAMAGLRGSCYSLYARSDRVQVIAPDIELENEIEAICGQGEVLFKANREMIEKHLGRCPG